jgi:hypothetical protein
MDRDGRWKAGHGSRSSAADEGGGTSARERDVGGVVVERLPGVLAHPIGLATWAEVAHGLLTMRACGMPRRWSVTTMQALATATSNEGGVAGKTPRTRVHT